MSKNFASEIQSDGHLPNYKMFSRRTFSLARLTLRNFPHSGPLTKTMPFTELVIPKLKAGPEVRAAFAAIWPISAKIFASSQPYQGIF